MESIFGIICIVLGVVFFVLPASSMEKASWERQTKLMRIEMGL